MFCSTNDDTVKAIIFAACSDVMSFEVTTVGDLGFSSDQPAADAQECAKLCYQAGCKTAAFSVDPEPKCLMNFEAQNCNPSASRYTEYAVNGSDVIQIQCILCGKSLWRSVLITQSLSVVSPTRR